MGIVWEAYHKGVPLLGVPGITLDPKKVPICSRLPRLAGHRTGVRWLAVAMDDSMWPCLNGGGGKHQTCWGPWGLHKLTWPMAKL